MPIPFWKMHGAGNDFILVDDRSLSFPLGDPAYCIRLCDRRRGVGAEGVLLLQPSAAADFRMRFINPDGTEAEMCGNGARCLARLAFEQGLAPADMTLETPAGIVRAEVLLPRVRLHLPPPHSLRMNEPLEWNGRPWVFHSIHAGVPHAVTFVDDLQAIPVAELGAHVRRHPLFQPAGTNVDVAQVTGPNSLAVRTYERGVEAETPACGTGVVASAWIARALDLVREPVQVRTAGGETLEVEIHPLTLTGPAEHVFQGHIPYR